MIVLDYEDVSKLIDFDLGLEWINEYYSLKDNNKIIEPQRLFFSTHNANNYLYLGGASILCEDENLITGFKNVNYFKENYEKYKKSNIFGSITIIDSKTGIIKLIADARRITYMRSVATLAHFLKHRISNTEKIGIIGAGQMLYYNIGFLTKILSTKEFSIFSKRIDKRTGWLQFIEKEFNISFKIRKIDEIISNSETLIIATNEMVDHVIDCSANLNNICALGSISKSYKGEIGINVYKKIKNVICDDVHAVRAEHGSISKIINDLELKNINDRPDTNQPLIFRSVGLMSQDIFFAYKLMNRIEKNNLYKTKDLDNLDLSYTWDKN